MERENKFYLRLDLEVDAENANGIIRVVNNILNAPELEHGIKQIMLTGMVVRLAGGGIRNIFLTQVKQLSPGLQGSQASSEMGSQEVGAQRAEILNTLSMIAISPSVEDIRYSSDQVVDFFPGLSRNKLYYWENQGYISPEIERIKSRDYRRFTVLEALKVGYIWKYQQEGMRLKISARGAEEEIAKLINKPEDEEIQQNPQVYLEGTLKGVSERDDRIVD